MTAPRESTRRSNDSLLIAVAIASLAVSIVSAIVGALGLLPAPISIIIVLGATSFVIRLALILRSRASSSMSGSRVMNVVSLCGLGLSALIAIAMLGVTLQHEDPWLFIGDLAVHAWSIVLLLAAATPVRTVGWRAMLGIGLTGFLVVSALARTIGRPVITMFGIDNVFGRSIWVPLTEEGLKVLPVAIVVLIAYQNRDSRPSVIDIALLGACSGTGFSLIENSEYHNLIAQWDAAPPFSYVFPTMEQGYGPGLFDNWAGHTVWTTFLSIGIGFGVLYFRRFRFAWVAIPVTFLIVVVEHGLCNALVIAYHAGLLGAWQSILTLTLGGMLSVYLLFAGFALLIWYERRPLRGSSGFRHGVFLTPEVVHARRTFFAASQAPRTITAAKSVVAEVNP